MTKTTNVTVDYKELANKVDRVTSVLAMQVDTIGLIQSPKEVKQDRLGMQLVFLDNMLSTWHEFNQTLIRDLSEVYVALDELSQK